MKYFVTHGVFVCLFVHFESLKRPTFLCSVFAFEVGVPIAKAWVLMGQPECLGLYHQGVLLDAGPSRDPPNLQQVDTRGASSALRTDRQWSLARCPGKASFQLCDFK